MKFDFYYQDSVSDLHRVPSEFARLEAAGYSAIWVREAEHDSFLPLAVGAVHTTTVQLGTAVAVAFARSPMTIAQLAHDLQLATGGRFALGLGTQMRGHIVRRFGMPFDPPGSRMRDYVSAVKAVWRTWNEGEPLNYHGQFYVLDKMDKYFAPRPVPGGPPPVYLGAVGAKMMRIAGEVADGVVIHTLQTHKYLTEVLRPAWNGGLEQRVEPLTKPFQVFAPVLVVTGRDERELQVAAQHMRSRIGFLGATPAYGGIFEHHGWENVHERLMKMMTNGERERLGDAIDDEVLDAFAVTAEPNRVAQSIQGRFGDIADRVSAMTPYPTTAELWDEISTGMRVLENRHDGSGDRSP